MISLFLFSEGIEMIDSKEESNLAVRQCQLNPSIRHIPIPIVELMIPTGWEYEDRKRNPSING
jgi:hypothetical protein